MSTERSWLPAGIASSPVARGAVATALSLLGNLGLVVLADALGVAPDFQAIAIPPVAFLTTLGAAGATATYVALGRFTADPDRTFRRVAVAVLVLSFLPDLALLAVDDAATVAGVVVLMAMHVVVAGVCLALLPRGER